MTISEMIILYHRHKTHRLWLDHIYTDDEIISMRKSMHGGTHTKTHRRCRYCEKMIWRVNEACVRCRAAIENGEIVPVSMRPHRLELNWGPQHMHWRMADGPMHNHERELDELIKLYEESNVYPEENCENGGIPEGTDEGR